MPASGEDGLQVVERPLELRRHVAGTVRVAVGVDGILAAAHEEAVMAVDDRTLPKPSRCG